MKKSGFTLIELLAVIVIIGILVALIVPNVLKSIDKYKTQEYEAFTDMLANSANLYASRHKTEINAAIDSNGHYDVTLQQLVDDNILTEPITDPSKNEVLDLNNNKVIIKKINGIFSSCFQDVCKD